VLVAIKKRNRKYREAHSSGDSPFPLHSVFHVMEILEANGIERQRGLVDYGTVDIPGLLRANHGLHLDIIMPEIEPVVRKIRKIQAAFPDRISAYPVSDFSKHQRVDKEPRFYDFVLSILGHQGRQDLYGSVKLGGGILHKGVGSDKEKFVKKNRSIAILCCTRGASTYMQWVLRGVGIKIGHDRYREDGIITGPAMIAHHCPGTILLHQVREPIGVIRSLITSPRKIHKLNIHIQGLYNWQLNGDYTHFAMRYWHTWNAIGKERGLFSYRVENIENEWGRIKRAIGIPEKIALPKFSKQSNTFKGAIYKPLSWSDLYATDSDLAEKIRQQAIDFGYEVS